MLSYCMDNIYNAQSVIDFGIILCIDFGLARIGLATSDPNQIIASPLKCLDNNGFKQTAIALEKIRLQYNFQYILIGWPLNMNGTAGKQCHLVENFCNKLYEHFAIPIIKWDERLSTRYTEMINQPKKGKHIDHIVATTLLQEYLMFLEHSRSISV